jgi:hypothetical protein
VPPWRRVVDTTRPTAVVDAGVKGRRTADGTTGSDSQTHRPRPQGWGTTGKRKRNENGAVRLDGTLFAKGENRNQQGGAHQDIGGRDQGFRRVNKCDRIRRRQTIRTIIGLGADLAGMLAIGRDIVTGTLIGREDTDRHPQ